MGTYIPLLQTILWIALIIFLIQLFRKEISLVRKAVSTRLEEGDSVELGPIKLGEIRRVAKYEAKEQIKGVVSEIDEVATQVRILNLLVTTQFDKYEVEHLKKFADDSKKLEVDPNSEQTRTMFRLELKHLNGQDFIEPIRAHEDAVELFTPGHGLKDAKNYYKITDRGRYYLSLLDEFGKHTQATVTNM